MRNRACLVLTIVSLSASLLACGTSTVNGNNTTSTGGGSTSNPSGGDGGAGTGGKSAGTGGDTTSSGGGPAAVPFDVSFPDIQVAPGEENTQCVLVQLQNDTPIHVNQIHNVLSQGSHHLIVYRTSDTEEQLTPYKCQPFADLLNPDKGTPLMITQKKDDTLELPDGVAFSIAAKQMVRLEMHYINTTTDTITVNATSHFLPMKESDVKNEADFLFVGNPDIKLQPHSTFTLGPTFIPTPAGLEGVKFFGFTGHEHQFGTDVTIETAMDKTGPGTSVYDVPGWSWSEPKTVYHDPPIEVPENGGFRFTCSWNNTSDQTVKFGESANDEMCFFWTYYYPSAGAFVCAHSDQYQQDTGGIDICCPGNGLCGAIFQNL